MVFFWLHWKQEECGAAGIWPTGFTSLQFIHLRFAGTACETGAGGLCDEWSLGDNEASEAFLLASLAWSATRAAGEGEVVKLET